MLALTGFDYAITSCYIFKTIKIPRNSFFWLGYTLDVNDISRNSLSNSSSLLKEAVQLGFYIGAGMGLAIGSAVSIVLGSNLFWQAGGLLGGAVLGMCGGVMFAWLVRRLRPTATPAYRGAR